MNCLLSLCRYREIRPTALLTLLWICTGVLTAQESDSRSLEFLTAMDKHAVRTLKTDPLSATYFGIDAKYVGQRLGNQLPDLSAAGLENAWGNHIQLRDTLDAFSNESLTGQAAVTQGVMMAASDVQMKLLQLPSSPTAAVFRDVYLVNQIGGIHLSVLQTMQVQQQVKSKRDAQDYLSRLKAIGEFASQVVDCLDRDAENGFIPPKFALTKSARGIREFVKSMPVENSLVTTFIAKISDVPEFSAKQRSELTAHAVKTVEQTVYPALLELAATLDSYRERSPEGAGVWRIPHGTKMYEILLQANGAAGRPAEEIHTIGLQEVQRISNELDMALRREGLTAGSVGDRIRDLYGRESLLYANDDSGREKLLADLNQQLDEIAVELPNYFGVLPPQSVEIRRIPVYEQESAAGGYYTPPPLDGSGPGIYWINLRDTAEWPSWTLKTLTYHEANPGHHFQLAIKQASKDTPMIRKLRFLGPFVEGWALYSEKLAYEMGMYDEDPFGNIGRLQSELFRAVRLVVDTGLHYKRWSRERAIRYMVQTTGNQQSEATTEIERYAVWPGQACSYKLGMIKIEELRARAESRLGAQFNLSDFHDAVLTNGDIPLVVLEDYINDWIEAQLRNR